MSEQNEWDHRSNFNDYDGDQASSVTEAVHNRQMGRRLSKTKERYILSDVDSTEEGTDGSPAHFGDRPTPSDKSEDPSRDPSTDNRSNREKLLDGERI